MLMTSISVTSGKFSIVALSSLTAVAISLQESQREKLDRLQTGGERQETRAGTRCGTQSGTQAAETRGSVRLPPLNHMTTTGSTYYRGRYKDLYNELVPKRQEPPHIWRDLAFNVRHDNNLKAKPFRKVDIVQR